MKVAKGKPLELFYDYDILCVPIVGVPTKRNSLFVKRGSVLEDLVQSIDGLSRKFLIFVRSETQSIRILHSNYGNQRWILPFIYSKNEDGRPEKETILESARQLSLFIDDNFCAYFRILIPPFDFEESNQYLREIVDELFTILDDRFTIVVPEKKG